MKMFWKQIVAMFAQQCESTSWHWIAHFEMVKTVNVLYIFATQKKLKISGKYLWVFLTKRDMDGERCLIFPLSLLLFHGGLSSSCLHTGLYRSFFLCFLFFMTCLVTCQGKSRVAVTVAITTNSSSLCTLESRGSFQGLFASDVPCTTQVRMCENSLRSQGWRSQAWECLSRGKPCLVHRAQSLLVRLFQCLKLGCITGDYSFLPQTQLLPSLTSWDLRGVIGEL